MGPNEPLAVPESGIYGTRSLLPHTYLMEPSLIPWHRQFQKADPDETSNQIRGCNCMA